MTTTQTIKKIENSIQDQPKCVFDNITECRILQRIYAQELAGKIIQPATNELGEIINAMGSILESALPKHIGFLHYYCALCTHAPINKEFLKHHEKELTTQ